jgi:hypothetical protein
MNDNNISDSIFIDKFGKLIARCICDNINSHQGITGVIEISGKNYFSNNKLNLIYVPKDFKG